MISLARIGVIAALLAVSLSGCAVTDWIARQIGVDDAVALNSMEKEFEAAWRDRGERLRAELDDPVFQPALLDDLKRTFLDISMRAAERAQGSSDARFRANFYHLAARAAIGAADQGNAESRIGALAEKGKEACAALTDSIRARTAVCLSMGLLPPIGVVNAVVRKIKAAQAGPPAAISAAALRKWVEDLSDQSLAFQKFEPNQAGENRALMELRWMNWRAAACNLIAISALAKPVDPDAVKAANDATFRIEDQIKADYRKRNEKWGGLQCLAVARSRVGSAPQR